MKFVWKNPLATESDELAFKAPAICKPAPILLEALEMNPPASEVRDATDKVFCAVTAPVKVEAPTAVKVLEAVRLPETFSDDPMELEAEEMKPPESVLRPETVNEPRVPTDVRDELTTELPSVVASRILVLLIRNTPPVGRFTLPEVRLSPPANVDVVLSPEIVVVAVRPM